MNENLHPPRVLFVLNEMRMGGSERQVLWLAGALRRHGCNVGILGLCPAGVVSEQCQRDGIPCHILPLSFPWSRYYTPLYLLRLALQLRRLRPEVISAFTSVPNVYCSCVWRWTGAKACAWNQRDEGIGRLGAELESHAVRSASGFIANSKSSAAFLTEVLNVDRSRVHVVPNALWTQRVSVDTPVLRRTLALGDAGTVATMVGNLRPPKDHATLLHAWRILLGEEAIRTRRPVLLLVGRLDSDAARTQALAAELGLESSVRFLGYQSDVQGILSASDIGVFSSRSEGLPNGVIECMAQGLPLAATDIPGVRECLPEEQRAFLAAPGDAASLADCLRRLITDASLRHDLGAKNLMHVERENAPDRIFGLYLDALASIWPGMRASAATVQP